MHLQPHSIIAENDEGGKGSSQTKGISSQYNLANSSPPADRANEKRSCYTPYNPVGPVKDGPVLREGAGAQGICPGGQSDKVLNQITNGAQTSFNNVSAFSSQEKYIGKEHKKQINAAGGSQLYTFHSKIDTEGVNTADTD